MKPGDVITIGRGRSRWKIQRIEERRTGQVLICYGPLDSPHACGGVCHWTGAKRLRRPSPLGGWITLEPRQVKPTRPAEETRPAENAGRKGGR